MRKLGFRTALIVREGAELAHRCEQEGFPVYCIDFSSKFNLPAWLQLLKLLWRLRPAVVNTHSSEDSWMAGCAARICGVPLIARTRHVLEPISSSFSYRAFPHVIFACSEAIAKQLAEQGVPRRKIVVQSTGIDEERFCFSAQDREEVRQQYNIGDQDILVGNVAFLRHYKGHEFIARTAAALPDRFKFMIVGGGNGRAILEKDIAKAGVQNRFILIGHREDPERFFSAFDLIFFSSYETEGISQSFIQGLLYGIPLLTCRTPSLLEPLEFVQKYKLVDYGDVEAAKAALLELATHTVHDEEHVRQQREDIAGKYGLRKMVENIVRVYGEQGVMLNHP
ncbi:MAG: Glycosyltransferase involved in cell wall bisynthesis [Candidatus Electronema aureum]|uniref:Glycosyltransferase involved in cell wall bisynthesis n=1 Tax=Candidatus Electronema aureum TaxID=2005002 RepID=A0A521G5I8_9BACT|nr:MAG: Glycosyltransferase involved in cell wall bisynthesis [Candidatus Electronema aureum]